MGSQNLTNSVFIKCQASIQGGNTSSNQCLCACLGSKKSLPVHVLCCRVAPTEPIYDTWATVQPDGHVHYSAYYHFRSLCQVTDDSSESLECPLSVGSWIHSTNYMAITANDRADAESYRANPDFMLISALSTTRERTCDCAPGETFSEVTYTISLERRNKESIWGVAGSNAVTSTSAVTIASLIAAITAVLLMTSAWNNSFLFVLFSANLKSNLTRVVIT